MIYPIVIFLLVVFASATDITPEVATAFQRFLSRYNKEYTSPLEYAKRIEIFAENLERIADLNGEHVALQGGEPVHGVTKFADLSREEFASMYLTYVPREQSKDVEYFNATSTAYQVDWRTKNMVTEVKDQGRCGSCWAFSAVEAVESYAFLSGKYPLLTLSAQQVNSCDRIDGGCNGGNTESAYQYIQSAGGLVSESDYPYTSGRSGRTGTCDFDKSDIEVSISGFQSVARGEANLKGVLNHGPVSICVAADSFQTYTGGILRSCPGRIDHCVQAVGYDDSENTWLVRNSWGTDWGEDGYIRVAQGKDLCRLADDVTYPLF